MTRADLVAAVDVAAYRLSMAREMLAGWRAQGIPLGVGAVVIAEARLADAEAALARYDRAT